MEEVNTATEARDMRSDSENHHPWKLRVSENAVRSRIILEKGDYVVVLHTLELGGTYGCRDAIFQVDVYHRYGERYGGKLIPRVSFPVTERLPAKQNWFDRLLGEPEPKLYTLSDAVRDGIHWVGNVVREGERAESLVVEEMTLIEALREVELLTPRSR